MLRETCMCENSKTSDNKIWCSSFQYCWPQKDIILLHLWSILACKYCWIEYHSSFYSIFLVGKCVGWLIVDLEIKILNDSFQAGHWQTNILCIGPEL